MGLTSMYVNICMSLWVFSARTFCMVKQITSYRAHWGPDGPSVWHPCMKCWLEDYREPKLALRLTHASIFPLSPVKGAFEKIVLLPLGPCGQEKVNEIQGGKPEWWMPCLTEDGYLRHPGGDEQYCSWIRCLSVAIHRKLLTDASLINPWGSLMCIFNLIWGLIVTWKYKITAAKSLYCSKC